MKRPVWGFGRRERNNIKMHIRNVCECQSVKVWVYFTLDSSCNVQDILNLTYVFFVALRANGGHGLRILEVLEHTQRRTTVGTTPLDE